MEWAITGTPFFSQGSVEWDITGTACATWCLEFVARICIAVVWLLRSPEGLHKEHSSAREGGLFPVVLQVQVAKNTDSTFLKESHRNKWEATPTASSLRWQGYSPSSSSSSSFLRVPCFAPPQVLASRDRKVIDGLKGYQSAIEQNHSSTAAQVLPASGRERSVFGKP